VTEHRCVYCDCPRLAAVREDVEQGSIVICGACGSLMVVDVNYDADPPAAFLRQPSQAESLDAHRDPDVKRFLDAYHVTVLEEAGQAKPKQKAKSLRSLKPGQEYTPGPLTIRGPDAR
jgi:hypothetical protein